MPLTSGIGNLVSVPQNVVLTDDPTFVAGNYLVFDVSKSEQHDKVAEVTDYPVEQGSNISDNSRPKPDNVTLEAFFSDFPIAVPFSQAAALSDTAGNQAYDQLRFWLEQATPLTLVTTLGTYSSMLITHIGVPRRADNTNGVECSLSLKQVFTVQSLSTAAPTPTKPSMNGNSSIGKKTPGAANSSATQNVSLAYKLLVH
jgi:Dit-like tail protein